MSCASGLMPNVIKTNKVTQWNKKKKLYAKHTNLSSKQKIKHISNIGISHTFYSSCVLWNFKTKNMKIYKHALEIKVVLGEYH
jgi:hypothetical protein